MLIILLMMLWTVMTIIFGVNIYELTRTSYLFPFMPIIFYAMWIMNFLVGMYFAKYV